MCAHRHDSQRPSTVAVGEGDSPSKIPFPEATDEDAKNTENTDGRGSGSAIKTPVRRLRAAG
jgi:hypothetical protein